MQERGWGRIVSIASIAAYSGGTVSKLAYAASKAGILGMTRFPMRSGSWWNGS